MTTLSIMPVSDRAAWDDFLAKLKPNTFLQSWEWGQVQERTGEGVKYLGIYRGEDLIGVALVVVVKARRGVFYLCPHGPLVTEDRDAADALDVLCNYLREHAREDKAVAVRISPLLTATPEHLAVFTKLGFRPAPLHMHTELTWMLDLAPADDELLRGMRKTTRHAIRRAEEQGVTVEVTSDPAALDRFLPLYQETKQRHAFVPFSAAFLRQQVAAFANGHFFMVVATHAGKDVAAALLVQYGDTVFYHHGASTKLPATVPAAQLLQWRGILEAKRRGATRYNFWGIAPEDKPHHPFAGITVFKKGFGGYAIDYLHAQDLSLSFAYWKLWLVDAARKWRRGF